MARCLVCWAAPDESAMPISRTILNAASASIRLFAQCSRQSAAQRTVILLGNGWDPHQAPYLRFAAQIGHQRAQQFGYVDVVGLGAAGAPINLHARRVDDVIAHAILFQQPMDPEPVPAS